MEKPSTAEETTELRELRAQVRALQAEVAHLRESKSGRRGVAREEEEREISNTLRDILDRGGEEASKLMRAIVVGYLEHLHLWAGEVDDFTRRVNERNRPSPDETIDDVARRLPREVTAEFLETIRHSFDFPHRVVDRMQKSFDETDETHASEPKVEAKTA